MSKKAHPFFCHVQAKGIRSKDSRTINRRPLISNVVKSVVNKTGYRLVFFTFFMIFFRFLFGGELFLLYLQYQTT